MLIKLYKLGEDDVVTTFSLGSHILGRGASLQCNDKRISRNHATIEITPEKVSLTSIHVNPCFLRAAEGKTITILKKDASTQLNDGDTFALLPDDFWFRIKICEEDAPEIEPKNEPSKVTSKRCSHDNDVTVEPPDKKLKIEVDNCDANNLDATSSAMEEASTSANQSENGTTVAATSNTEVECKAEDKEEETNESKEEETSEKKESAKELDEDEPQTDQVSTKLDQDDQSKADPDDNNPGTSKPKPRREKCWYGAQCYRKNPVHRQDYTHPGDSDYESDPDDNRPSCSYGAACYRKNKDHRREYKHPPTQPPSKKKRNRKKVDRLNVADSEEMREFDDSEDPFIDDDDSDEYTAGSGEDDSDWEDSQEQDEDGENIKRLVKEANRFVKK